MRKFSIIGRASVDIRPLPGAWVAELLGVVLEVQDHKKIKFPMATLGLKGLSTNGFVEILLFFEFDLNKNENFYFYSHVDTPLN